MAVLSLCCCTDFSLVLVSRGYSPVAAHRLLTPVASLVAEHRLQVQGLQQLWLPGLEHRLNSCGQRAQLLWDMCDLLRSEIKSVSPALAGGFFTTGPPEKPYPLFFRPLEGCTGTQANQNRGTSFYGGKAFKLCSGCEL